MDAKSSSSDMVDRFGFRNPETGEVCPVRELRLAPYGRLQQGPDFIGPMDWEAMTKGVGGNWTPCLRDKAST